MTSEMRIFRVYTVVNHRRFRGGSGIAGKELVGTTVGEVEEKVVEGTTRGVGPFKGKNWWVQQ